MFHVGAKSKHEYTRCKKALCSGAHLSFVCPWSLAVPIAGELLEWSCSLWCSLEHLSQHGCDVLQHTAHMQFVPEGWQLAHTSLLLRTLSGHTEQEPYCATVLWTTALLSMHCSSDQCRRHPGSDPFYWKMECAETTPYPGVYILPVWRWGRMVLTLSKKREREFGGFRAVHKYYRLEAWHLSGGGVQSPWQFFASFNCQVTSCGYL